MGQIWNQRSQIVSEQLHAKFLLKKSLTSQKFRKWALTNIKATQYVDDCTLFLAGLNNIPEAFAQIKFTRVSGLKLNIEKTEGMNVGTLRPVYDKIYNIKFVNKPIEFLGIYVGENETACNEKNWNEKILEIEKK